MQQSVETVRAILRALGVENWESFGLYPDAPGGADRSAHSREPADAPREEVRGSPARRRRSRAGVG